MTVKELIKGLQAVNEHIGKHFNEGGAWMAEFIDNAINELEQQPITWIVGKNNCQVAVRNMSIDKMQKICAIIGEEEQQSKTIQEKQAESEKYQKAFDDGYENGYAQARFDYGQQPCEDCISRKETIEWLKKVTVTDGITFKTGFEQILYDIEQMPSVTPKASIPPVPKKKAAVNRQVIVTWFTPEEKLPEEDVCVLATVTATVGNKRFIRTVLPVFYCKDEGWCELDYGFDEMKIHAWCDLEPYGGN